MSKNTAYKTQLDKSRKLWNDEAPVFDNEPDHGLLMPEVRTAWTSLLEELLPVQAAEILDMGCGTGSLSVLMAELGHDVTGVDLSPAMLSIAAEKAAVGKHKIRFHCMDAAFPTLPPQQFDVIICRHVLWALPEPEKVLQRWVQLLRPNGEIVLIEGYWYTGTGLHSDTIIDMLPDTMTQLMVKDLSPFDNLWNKSVTDDRFVVSATLSISTR